MLSQIKNHIIRRTRRRQSFNQDVEDAPSRPFKRQIGDRPRGPGSGLTRLPLELLDLIILQLQADLPPVEFIRCLGALSRTSLDLRQIVIHDYLYPQVTLYTKSQMKRFQKSVSRTIGPWDLAPLVRTLHVINPINDSPAQTQVSIGRLGYSYSSISSHGDKSYVELITELLQSLPALSTLILTEISPRFEFPLTHFASVKTLSLASEPGWHMPLRLGLLSPFPNVSNLLLDGMTIDVNSLIRDSPADSPKSVGPPNQAITELTLSNCTVSPPAWKKISGRFTGLQSLTLIITTLANIHDMLSLPLYLQSVTAITIDLRCYYEVETSGNVTYANDGMPKIDPGKPQPDPLPYFMNLCERKCPRLKSLTVRGAPLVKFLDFMAFKEIVAPNFTQLDKLSFTLCLTLDKVPNKTNFTTIFSNTPVPDIEVVSLDGAALYSR